MSRLVFQQARTLMRKNATSALTRRALFSTSIRSFQQQQQQAEQDKKVTHFGFRDVAEEDKESLGKRPKLKVIPKQSQDKVIYMMHSSQCVCQCCQQIRCYERRHEFGYSPYLEG
jgi:hypothetical protein